MVASAATARAYPAIQAFIRSVPASDTVPIPQDQLVVLFVELRRLEKIVRRNGNGRHIAEIEDRIYRANMRLVISECNRFFYVGQSWADDLLQEGSKALLMAIRGYTPPSQFPFYSYARRSIRNRLSNFFRDHVRNHCAIHMSSNGHISEYDKNPIRNTTSMDVVVSGVHDSGSSEGYSEATMHNLLHEQSAQAPIDAAIYSEAWAHIDNLPSRARRVLTLRFRKGLTYQEIADKLKLTKQRIWQIYQDSIASIRTQMLRHER